MAYQGVGATAAAGIQGGWDALAGMIADRRKQELIAQAEYDKQQQAQLERDKFAEQTRQFDTANQRMLEIAGANEAQRKETAAATAADKQVDNDRLSTNALGMGTHVTLADFMKGRNAGLAGGFTPDKINPTNPNAPQTFTWGGSAEDKRAAASLAQTKLEAEANRKSREDLATQAQQAHVDAIRIAAGLKGGGTGPTSPVPGLGVSGNEALAGVPPDQQRLVKMLANYELPVPARAATDPHFQQLISLAKAYDPTFDETKYQARQKLRNDYTGGGKSALTIRSFNTATAHLGELQKAADALGNGDYPAVNSVRNAVDVQRGIGKVNAFNSAATAVEGELANAFKQSGATDQEIHQWRQTIDFNQSPAQIAASIRSATNLLAGRIQAVRQQYVDSMGGKQPDFQILTPQSREMLSKMGVDTDTLDPALAPPSSPAAVSAPGTASDDPFGVLHLFPKK